MIAIQKPDGTPDIREATSEEIAAMTPTEQEIALQEWQHVDFAMRIVAPIDLLLPDPANILFHQFYNWFTAQKFPIEYEGSNMIIWCNLILEQHLAIMNDLVSQGVITIEQRP